MANPIQETSPVSRSGLRRALRIRRAREAREQFLNGGAKRDSNIIKSIKNLFKPTTRQEKRSSAGYSYGGKKGQPVIPSGQYQYTGAAVKQWRKSVQPTNMVEYARMAAKADTTTDPAENRFYNQYRINQHEHDRIIEVGQKWMVDEEAYTRWILSAPTPDEQNRRIKLAQEYMESALHDVPTYDPATHTYATQKQFKSDAPLPPWISPTTYKQDLWDYYITYSHDVVQASADAYRHALDESREQARNPYKSAFANAEQGGQVDSFLDIMIKAMDPSTVDQDILGTYLNEYYINPIKTGHLKTAAGNALWNLMDTMDIASRGVRALVAGETALGGSDQDYVTNNQRLIRPGEWDNGTIENHQRNDAKFKGQNVYWVELEGHTPEETRRAQELFMRSGGYELLMKAHPNEASRAMLGSERYNQSTEELEAHLDAMFEHYDIDWRDIYNDIDKNYFTNKAKRDLKQGVANVKKAYTDVDATFNADTGSMAADMIVETVLDPGLIAGGIAKNVTAKGVESAAETAVKEGLWNASRRMADVDEAMSNKGVQAALRNLISSNEGRNIIFKNSDKFGEDVDLFITKARQFTKAFDDDEAQKVFKDTVVAHLMGKQTSINGAIIGTQDFARNALDSKSFKAAYYLDKAIDATDSAIIKSSFFLPWAGVKGAKALGSEASVVYKRVMDSEFMQKAMARIGIREKNAARTVIDEMTGEVNVTKVTDLMRDFEAGIHHEKDVRKAFHYVVDSYDDAAQEVTNIIQRFSNGSITDEEALRFVSDKISAITGGQYKSVQELAGHINDISIMRYAGDIRSAYGRIDDAFRRLQNLIDRRSENAVEGFIDEIRQLQNKEELPRLFREHMDNSFILDLRQRVIDNAQFNITSEEIDNIINDLRTGRWTDETVTKEQIGKGVAAQKKIAEKTLNRTVTFDTFDNILKEMDIDWEGAAMAEAMDGGSAEFSKLERKLGEFMVAWQKQPEVTYVIDDALKFVDRIERQIHFKEIMDIGTASEASALAAHQLVADCNKLRKHIKRLDLINLKDVKQIVLPQLDRMALNQAFINNTDIQNAYGSFYDDVIAPIWNELKTARTDEVDFVDSSLFQDVDELAKQRYGFNRTQQLVDEVKTLQGFSDDHLHSFLNTLATDFRFRDELGNIDLTPGGLRRKVEATLRAQTGQSKLGMKNMTDALQSIGSSNPSQFMKDYVEEFAEKPWLEERWNRYVNADVLDPKAYVEKQMLFTALADPSVIPEWNRLAERGQAPILFHINSTGLNNEINSMTSISFRKWVPLDISDENPLTIERLLDAMDSEETTVFQRGMSDSDLNEFTEQVIRQLDMKDCDPSSIMKRYKEIYGVSDNVPYKSEQQMIEEACDYIRSATRTVDENGVSRSVAPTLVVHDLDGFNTNYFNNRVMALTDSVSDTGATRDYIDRIAKSVKDNSCNTYTRLAERSGDLYYTDEQLEQITNIIHDYIDDINHFANGYRMNDMQTYSRKLHDIIKELDLKEANGELTEQEEKFLKLFNEKRGTEMLNAYDLAIKQVTSLGLYPRQYAFVSTGLEDNFTKAAMEAAGRTSVNVNNRIYVDDILSYFNLETEDGFYASIEDLKQMNSMAKYIKNTRSRQIVAGAEEFLQPHKADFDRIIQSVIDIARGNSYESIKLSYMQNMKIPDNAVDSYLMAKKLYNDHLKYWLDTDELTSLRTGGKDLDAAKQRMLQKGYEMGFKSPEFALENHRVFQQACDYINNNRVRFFDELTGGGFDINKYDSYYELSERFAEESTEFWNDVSETTSRMWDDFKEFNAAMRDEYAERYDRLNKQFTDYQTDKEFKNYYYERVQEKWGLYREQRQQQEELYKELLDTFDDNDPRWAEYDANKDYMKDLRESIEEDYTLYSENQKAYKKDWFDDGKFKLRGKSKEIKAEKAKAEAGALHPGWGRKTTQRRIKKAVRDTLHGTNLNTAERREAIEKIDDAAKRASRLMAEGKESEAANIIYDAVDDITKNMKRVDNEAYEASKELRQFLRNTPIATDSIKNDITDFAQFRKSHFGSYKLHKQGTDLDQLLTDHLKKDFPQYFNSYDKEGPSGFFEFTDKLLSDTNPKVVDFPDAEKEYLRDKLVNEVYDTLFERPGYSISDTDDNFTEVYNRYVHEKKRPMTYEGVKQLSDTEYALAQEEYLQMSLRQRREVYENLNKAESVFDTSSDVLDLLQGAHEPEIYNWAARSDFEKRVVSYKDGVMKSGLDKAAKYTEANSQIKSEMRQLQHIDDYFTTAGITKRQDRMTASVYQKTNQLFNILEQTGFLKRESFHTFMEKASEIQRLQLTQYRLNALRDSAGAFDRNRLLSDLVYNGFNMSVFNAYNYTPNEIRELREFVEGLQRNGDDFLSYYEDASTGNIFIYLNDNAVVAEADNARWINQSIRLERPVNQAVPYADFDELAEVLDLDDIEDFRGIYSHLLSCWDDTRLLSLGQINGTTGRTVTRKQAEDFIQSLPSNMNDWLTSEGLLRDELTRGIIYDPGFVISDRSDMLTDFLGTLQRQAETAKDDAILINEVFHSNSNVKINDLAEHFTTDELIEYFGENPEYVVCTIVADEKTATGLSVRQINMSTSAGVEAAKNTPNTTILPYSTYYEISNYMNRDVTDNVYKQLLGKYMLVYKAFSLAMPGTWMRNFIDATTKAAFDNGQGVSNLFSMVQYEGKAARDIGTYGKIIASDPSLLTPANWDWVQRVYKTDMTFEDFELLRGIMDGDRYKTADKAFLSRTARQRQGFNIISGENVGLRNLEDKEIREAFDKYLATDMDLPLSKNEFLDIYTGKVQPDEAMNEAFEDMFRKLSNNMRNSNAQTIFDKAVDTMFKPFGSVEQCVRYAQSLMLRDNGFSANQITRHIHNTQFYNAPVWGTWRKLETIMPFVTFKFNNMMYWVRMMDENPRLFRYFEDTYRSVYETSIESALQEGDELDYETDYGLQSGGIPLGNGGMYLNLGNSFLSAMNDFYGLPHDFDSLNPLIRDTARASMYALGFSSSRFFSTVDLNIADDDIVNKAAALVPGYTTARKAAKLFKNLQGISTESGGPTMNVLCSTLNFLGVLGIRQRYGGRNGKFDFDAYQEELAAQGKWYDSNLGKVVDISQKNSYGANDPNNTFEDVQQYMLVHFGKVWDANQHKFVKMADYQEGGLNEGFDFENDPEAWTKLQQYMATHGKFWDNNQRKFVYTRQYIGGGLNAEGLEWESIVALTEEKFPNLKWDANQQAFVDRKYYIAGGMNDVRDFREVMGLRQALYGETYDRETHKFIKTGEPTVVMMSGFMDNETRKKYDNYYSLLGIPRLDMGDKNMHVNQDGLLVTGDGKYVLTGNPEYDERVFSKFRNTFSAGGRRYNGHKNYSYRKTKRSNKPYKGRSLAPTYYASAGWRSNREGFREAFEYNYHYHSPQPAAKLNRLITPPIFYPYGGGYSKYSFQSRY